MAKKHIISPIFVRGEEMQQEGLAQTYRATDDDLPSVLWTTAEEDFWNEQIKTIGEIK